MLRRTGMIVPKMILFAFLSAAFSVSLTQTTYAYYSGTGIDIDPNDHTGAHWKVKAETGYNKATGFLTVPTVNITDNSNTVPYMYFGAYTNDGALASDLGIFYKYGSWKLFVNVLVWNPSIDGYEQEWKEYSIPQLNEYYLVLSVDNSNSSYDLLKITIKNPNTWADLKYIEIKTNEVGDMEKYYSTKKVLNNSYSNLYLVRETTLAQGTEDLDNGSYLHSAIWENVYIYSPSGYWQWGKSQTDFAGKSGNSIAVNKVTVNSYSEYYKDNISINY